MKTFNLLLVVCLITACNGATNYDYKGDFNNPIEKKYDVFSVDEAELIYIYDINGHDVLFSRWSDYFVIVPEPVHVIDTVYIEPYHPPHTYPASGEERRLK